MNMLLATGHGFAGGSLKESYDGIYNILSLLITFGQRMYLKMVAAFEWLFTSQTLALHAPLLNVVSGEIRWISLELPITIVPAEMFALFAGGWLFAVSIINVIRGN